MDESNLLDKIKSLSQYSDQMSQYLATTSTLNLWPFVINILVGFGLALILRWHFKRFGSTLSNRQEFGSIFPMIVLTIILIISVVKSSLALALGLVGALSIVRFRTPVKEPEELAYLFLAIGIGLALGAGQTLAAVVAAILILTCISYAKSRKKGQSESGLFLSLDWKPSKDMSQEKVHHWLADFEKTILEHVNNCDLRRFDEREDTVEALYYIDISNRDHLSKLSQKLKESFSGIGITFLDQKNVSGF